MKRYIKGTLLAIQWLRLHLPTQWVRVPPWWPVKIPCGSWAKNKTKQKQYCKKFNKDFKNGPLKKKTLKKKRKRERDT